MSDTRPLDDDALSALAARLAVASPLHADFIADVGIGVTDVPVPKSFGEVSVYEIVIPVRRRPIEILAADLGDDVIVLGSPDRVHALVQRIGLHLESADDVVDYLRFWCRSALGKTERLVEGPIDFRWISAVHGDLELRSQADRASRLARWIAVRGDTPDRYVCEATVLEQRTLQLREFVVTAEGQVEETSRVELEQDVPVPYAMP